MKNSKQKSRTLKFALISLMIMQCLFSYILNGQSISTISEIYNYEIGDIFHTREYESSPGSGFSKYFNIQIIDKYYSSNNDTLYYLCDVKTALSTNINPQYVYNSYLDTIFYTNLDSLINGGQIDTVYYSSYYNGKKTNSWSYFYVEDYTNLLYIDGCGGPYYYSFTFRTP